VVKPVIVEVPPTVWFAFTVEVLHTTAPVTFSVPLIIVPLLNVASPDTVSGPVTLVLFNLEALLKSLALKVVFNTPLCNIGAGARLMTYII
jgi:hypothetical protein